MQNIRDKKFMDRKSLRQLFKNLQKVDPEFGFRVVVGEAEIFSSSNLEQSQHHIIEIEGRQVRLELSPTFAGQDSSLTLPIFEHLLAHLAQKSMLGQEILEKYREINSIFQLSSALHDAKFLEDVGQAICHQVADALQCGSVILAIRREIRKKEMFVQLSRLGEPIHSDETELLSCIRNRVADNGIADILNQPGEQGFPPELQGPLIFAPLRAKEEDLGGLVLANPKSGAFDSGDLKLAVTLASASAYSLENALLFEEIEQVFDSMMRGMIAAIDERDSATSGHSARISMISEKFAKAVNRTHQGRFADMSFSREQLREIRYAGLLHDIGKIGVREEVLKKRDRLHPGFMHGILARLDYAELLLNQDLSEARNCVQRANKAYNLDPEDGRLLARLHETTLKNHRAEPLRLLTEFEYEALSLPHGNLTWPEVQEMRKHPAGSLKILSKIQFSKDLRNIPVIAAQHHEKLDGSGYPLGITSEKILPQSQIMCIADIYEAIVAKDRPYKPPLSRETALEIIEREVHEGKIDADLFAIFKDNLDAIVGPPK